MAVFVDGNVSKTEVLAVFGTDSPRQTNAALCVSCLQADAAQKVMSRKIKAWKERIRMYSAVVIVNFSRRLQKLHVQKCLQRFLRNMCVSGCVRCAISRNETQRVLQSLTQAQSQIEVVTAGKAEAVEQAAYLSNALQESQLISQANELLGAENVRLSSTLETADAQLAQLSSDCSEAEQTVRQLTQQLADAQHTVQQLADSEAVVEAEAGRLGGELEASEGSVADLSEELANVVESETEKAQQVVDLKGSLEKAQRTINSLQAVVESNNAVEAETERLSEEQEDLRLQLAVVTDSKALFERQASLLVSALSEAKQSIEELEESNTEIKLETQRLGADLVGAKQSITELTEGKAAVEAEAERLELAKAVVEVEKTSSIAEATSLRVVVEDARSQIQELEGVQDSKAAIQIEAQRWQAELIQSKEKIDLMQAVNESTVTTAAAAKACGQLSVTLEAAGCQSAAVGVTKWQKVLQQGKLTSEEVLGAVRGVQELSTRLYAEGKNEEATAVLQLEQLLTAAADKVVAVDRKGKTHVADKMSMQEESASGELWGQIWKIEESRAVATAQLERLQAGLGQAQAKLAEMADGEVDHGEGAQGLAARLQVEVEDVRVKMAASVKAAGLLEVTLSGQQLDGIARAKAEMDNTISELEKDLQFTQDEVSRLQTKIQELYSDIEHRRAQQFELVGEVAQQKKQIIEADGLISQHVAKRSQLELLTEVLQSNLLLSAVRHGKSWAVKSVVLRWRLASLKGGALRPTLPKSCHFSKVRFPSFLSA